MAQQELVRLVDDLDGSDAVATVMFGLDDQTYAIDLSADHAAELRMLLAPYVSAGRCVGDAGRRSFERAGTGSRKSVGDGAAIRTWARQQGLDVPRRGRIPAHVRQAYSQREAADADQELPVYEATAGRHQQRQLPPVADPFALPLAR